MKTKKQLEELKELEEDVWNFKLSKRYYTLYPRNIIQVLRWKRTKKTKVKLLLQKFKRTHAQIIKLRKKKIVKKNRR